MTYPLRKTAVETTAMQSEVEGIASLAQAKVDNPDSAEIRAKQTNFLGKLGLLDEHLQHDGPFDPAIATLLDYYENQIPHHGRENVRLTVEVGRAVLSSTTSLRNFSNKLGETPNFAHNTLMKIINALLPEAKTIISTPENLVEARPALKIEDIQALAMLTPKPKLTTAISNEVKAKKQNNPRGSTAKSGTERYSLRSSYLGAHCNARVLSAQEEIDLSKRIEAGLMAQHKLDDARENGVAIDEQLAADYEQIIADGKKAKDEMIVNNIPWLIKIIGRHYPKNKFEEALECGAEGLIRAVEKFDYTKGNKFATYATFWIRLKTSRGLDELEETIHRPQNIVADTRAIITARTKFGQENGRQPTNEELPKLVKLHSGQTIDDLETNYKKPSIVSLDAPINSDNTESGTLQDTLDALPTETDARKLQLESAVSLLFDNLPLSQARALEMHLGIGTPNDEPLGARIIAKKLGIRYSKVQSLIDSAMADVQSQLEGNPELRKVLHLLWR
jgi:RNA polymerase nonessential primary-like sigma factor